MSNYRIDFEPFKKAIADATVIYGRANSVKIDLDKQVLDLEAKIHRSGIENEELLKARDIAHVEGLTAPDQELVNIDALSAELATLKRRAILAVDIMKEKHTLKTDAEHKLNAAFKAMLFEHSHIKVPVFQPSARIPRPDILEFGDLTLLDLVEAHLNRGGYAANFYDFLTHIFEERTINAHRAGAIEKAKLWNAALPEAPKPATALKNKSKPNKKEAA